MLEVTMTVTIGCDYCDLKTQETVKADEDGLPPVHNIVRHLTQFGDYVEIPHLKTRACKACLNTRMGTTKEQE